MSSEPVAGDRLALGGVRAAAQRRYDPLPPNGPDRMRALVQLRSVIAGDVVRSITQAVEVGWHPLDYQDIADGYIA